MRITTRIFYSVLGALLCIIFIEGGLALLYKFTLSKRFSTLQTINPYPRNPEKYVKVAVFGGSAAKGYNSEKGFAEILEKELKVRYPQLMFYVKNYAQSSYPFHRYEAEILKAVMNKYDFLLVYAGDNEPWNYLDDTGYFRTSAFKGNKEIVFDSGLINEKVSVLGWIRSNSRLFAIIQKLSDRFKAMNLRTERSYKASGFYNYKKFTDFSGKSILPPNEIENIKSNFRKELDEIGRLADAYHKNVIVSSIPLNETIRPFFSVHRQDLSPSELESFERNFSMGKEFYRRNAFSRAIPLFLSAYGTDNTVSALNFMLGDAYLRDGDKVNAHRFFVAASDSDGWPMRSLSPLRDIAVEISKKYKYLDFVDNFTVFECLFDRGVEYNVLFNDYQHPSFLGHAVIANNFLCRILQKQPFVSSKGLDKCFDNDHDDVFALAQSYKKIFALNNKEEAHNDLMVMQWYLSLSFWAADPNYILDKAGVFLDKFSRDIGEAPSTDARVSILLYRAFIEAGCRPPDLKKSVYFANEARKISPVFTYNLINQELNTGVTMLESFSRNGINYSQEEGFSLK